MSDLLLAERIDAHRLLCVSDLSAETVQDELGDETASANGLFLYVLDDRPIIGGIKILARVASYDAALEIIDLLVPALHATSTSRRGRRRRKAVDTSASCP